MRPWVQSPAPLKRLFFFCFEKKLCEVLGVVEVWGEHGRAMEVVDAGEQWEQTNRAVSSRGAHKAGAGRQLHLKLSCEV
jgi:hypothetical protein